MEWNTLYGQNNPPTSDDVYEYVGNELWGNLSFILQIYPKFIS